ncbi:MAG: YeeE/YedE family protein [Betaproteobacteria bacterium]|nr:YeeE/YedE family protein [Betaproteobacteria bacterium]
MSSASNLPTLVALSGFGIAFVFGAVAQRTNFCTMGAISDVVNMGSWGRMRMWMLAMAVAIAGATALHLTGTVDLSKSIYTRPGLAWLSFLVGGFVFGVGMTLGSGCGNKTLLRIGAGSLKSVVVLAFLAISAYMTIKGLFAIWRVTWLDPVSLDLASRGVAGQDLPSIASALFGVERKAAYVGVASVAVVALVAFIFKDRDFRGNFDHILGGVVLGAAIVAGWYVTGHIGFGENPDTLENTFFGTNSRTIESLSFVAPAAYLLEILLLWSDKSLAFTFGIALGLGVIAGSATYALATRTFRWEGFVSAEDTANHVVGGILMGFGGVTALGCTIGQGITGISTLALGSVLTTLAIVAGSWATMKYQVWRLEREA